MRRHTIGNCNAPSMGTLTNKLLIACREETDSEVDGDDENERPHPHCAHGPTLLFYHEQQAPSQGYFGCAAHRDKRECAFHLPAGEPFTSKHLPEHYEPQVAGLVLQCRRQRELVKQSTINRKSLHYCLQCNTPFLKSSLASHAGHDLVRNLSASALSDPTQFLLPLADDKVQAQYFFDEKALQFFVKCFDDLNISKVVCIGAPRLHAHLRRHCPHIASFLLDYDRRFFAFYDDDSYAWYNMCNNHFFVAEQRLAFQQFLQAKTSTEQRLLLFTDPPFGCRTEPIAHTLHSLQRRHNRLNGLPHQPLAMMWVFPYYSAHYIEQVAPALAMCDYKINYTNHLSYTDSGAATARKLGSPVRVFTNVPLSLLKLPIAEGYKYCASCERYTALENRHCRLCGRCPAKNGSTYRHCDECGSCVKPTYVHCAACRRCTQAAGHNCAEYQAQQRCWICRRLGHIEWNCPALAASSSAGERTQLIAKQGKRKRHQRSDSAVGIVCLLCGRGAHNERDCTQRGRFIEESTFLGETSVMDLKV